jgi:hypothetical protein
MLDHDVVAVSPASVWRVLKQAGLLSRWKAAVTQGDRLRKTARAAVAFGTSIFSAST